MTILGQRWARKTFVKHNHWDQELNLARHDSSRTRENINIEYVCNNPNVLDIDSEGFAFYLALILRTKIMAEGGAELGETRLFDDRHQPHIPVLVEQLFQKVTMSVSKISSSTGHGALKRCTSHRTRSTRLGSYRSFRHRRHPRS